MESLEQEKARFLGLIVALNAACESAAVSESINGQQASSARWTAVLRLKELAETCTGIRPTLQEIMATVEYEPPYLDPKRPCPGSRIVAIDKSQGWSKPIAIRKRPQSFKGTPMEGKPFELVQGGDMAYHGRSTPRIEYHALLGEYDTLGEAKAALADEIK